MDNAQLIKILQRYPLFQDIKEAELKPLIEDHKFKNIRHRDKLYTAGEAAESFALVLTGAFKLVRPTPRGEDAIMYFAIPGDVIGGLVMLNDKAQYPISAVAIGNSTVIVLPRAVYRNAWMKSALVQSKLNSLLYTRMSSLQDEKANTKLPLQRRVAALLMNILDRYPQANESKLPIPLTRQEIADAVGASVESVIRCMSEMSQAGILRTEDKHIEILRTDKIAELLRD